MYMLTGKERQIVLDYLYQECIANSKDSFASRRKINSKIESKLKYEHISNKEKIEIYKKIVKKQIIEYLIHNITNSLTMEWVNGNPTKRDMRIEEWACNKYNGMSKAEKVAICEILGFKYLSN